ncbi:putative T7SS-secreted protein, partial [Kitasatospora cystarginea]|uniref:putative T7SS-secreted protein n=1 Tax=Kitasatospora cystarginea TaxID=58350 RepID=UPI0031D5A9ED
MGVLGSLKSGFGEFVDANAHLVGKGLDMVGAHGAAHAVDNWGDHIADDLGAAVGELNLGQSDDPKELLHGDAKAIGESAQHLQKFAQAFEETGAGLTRLDSEHWQGEAAEAFRKKFSPQPRAWVVVGEACAAAGKALETYQSTITWAQDQAQQAIDGYNAAKKASEEARGAYNRRVEQYNSALDDYKRAASAGQSATPPTVLGEFHDPGEEGFKQAQEVLRSARRQRDDAARTAGQAIAAATGSAPKEPGLWDRIGMDVADLNTGAAVGAVHFAGGVVKGATDLVKFVRGLNPQDPYNMTHPALYLDHVSTVAAGLVHTANHPTELVTAMVGSGWGKDPAEAGGTAVFNLLSGMATGGGSEAGVAGARMAMDAAAAAGERGGIKAGESAAQNAAENAARKAATDGAEQAGASAFNRPGAPQFDVSAFPQHVRPTEPA